MKCYMALLQRAAAFDVHESAVNVEEKCPASIGNQKLSNAIKLIKCFKYTISLGNATVREELIKNTTRI